VKQPFPSAVSLYFPQTTLSTDKIVQIPANNTIGGIQANEMEGNDHTARIEISLKEDIPYEINRLDTGLKISFHKERDNTSTTDNSPRQEKNKTTNRATCLYSIDTKQHEGELRILVRADGEIKDYKSFSIDNPPKIVFDIFNLTTSLKNEAALPINTELVKKITHYIYHDRIRLIMETDGTYSDCFTIHPVAAGLLIIAEKGEDATHTQVAPETAARGLAQVRRIDFSSKDSGTSSLIIETTKPVKYKVEPSEDRRHRLMLFDTDLPLSLTFLRYESAVVQILPVLEPTSENAAVFEMDMRKRVPYLIEQTGSRLTIHFEASTKLSRLHEKIKPQLKKKPKIQDQPPIKEEVYLFIHNWKSAWENTAGDYGDIEAYISHYSNDFSAGGLDKEGWKRDKRKKNRKRGWISGEVMEITTKPAKNNQLQVRFFLDYKSPNYNEILEKTLILRKEKTEWKIVNEKTRLTSQEERNRMSIKP
jgi:hypothetical protein